MGTRSQKLVFFEETQLVEGDPWMFHQGEVLGEDMLERLHLLDGLGSPQRSPGQLAGERGGLGSWQQQLKLII